MDIQYIKQIQKWVELDNATLKNKESIKSVVEEKKDIEETIIEYVGNNKLENINISITDGNIKFQKKNTVQPLNIKTLRNLLQKYNDETPSSINIDEVCDFITKNLDVKVSYMIKRTVASSSNP